MKWMLVQGWLELKLFDSSRRAMDVVRGIFGTETFTCELHWSHDGFYANRLCKKEGEFELYE